MITLLACYIIGYFLSFLITRVDSGNKKAWKWSFITAIGMGLICFIVWSLATYEREWPGLHITDTNWGSNQSLG